ncbi:hypothetical protein ACHQM5_019919 [Ranunculus cassubicifolius]
MGVPSFYRWLVNKYPNIVVQARVPKDDDDPNGNQEFDNLYLDMNGIIHPCFHPDDQDSPGTFDQVFQNVFEYIDWLLKIVRPKKLLFMAIDGVAPRAKMNQQRSRRFRTAKDAEIADLEEEKMRKEFEKAGKKLLPKQESEVSDSNVITPGTVFMHELSKALQNYVCARLRSDPGWKKIKVILSDANSPGEGEHKIMKFIRAERTLPGYDPNTRHCLYGLDADLIMLALATHELHFSILREDVLTIENSPSCVQDLQISLAKYGNNGLLKSDEGSNTLKKEDSIKKPYKKPYQFLNAWTLREYLEVDLQIADPPVDIDFERILDDFIFICFFTGNDFLPHMPSLEIRERAVDLLMAVYRDDFGSRGGYLVDTKNLGREADYVDLKRVEKFILAVGTYEDRIFKKRLELRQLMVKRLLREMSTDVDVSEIEQEDSLIEVAPIGELHLCSRTKASDATSLGTWNDLDDILKNTKELQKQLKDVMRDRTDIFKQGGLEKDQIRLGMHGWRERYYKEKFSAENKSDVESTRSQIVQKYVEGLCWVLHYYFSGVGSWSWFYPYHYAPFASDLKGLGKIKVSFSMGTPLKPYDQLMGVLPPKSACALPKAYWPLMTSDDSKLIDFYPTDFNVDVDGKRYLWQGIVKLPFIDEKRLTSETEKVEKDLTVEEVERNSESKDKIFEISASCSTYEYPQVCAHVPRLLANVTIPEKTITEADLLKQPLWHEFEGYRPTARSHFHDRYKKPVDDRKSASSNHFSANEIHKDAGCGFSMGRGTHPGYDRKVHMPNNLRPQSYSSWEVRNYVSGQGRSNIGMSGNESSMQTKLSSGYPFGNGMGPREARNQISESSAQTQALSSFSMDTGKWVSGRGRGYVESSQNLTYGSYGSNRVGYSEGLGRGRGFVEPSRNQSYNAYSSVDGVNNGMMHSPSAGRAWAGAGSNGQGRRVAESTSNQVFGSHIPTQTNNIENGWSRVETKERRTQYENRTSGSYNTMHRVSVGREVTPTIGHAWAGTGRQEFLGSTRNQPDGSYSSNQNMSSRNMATSSEYNGWSSTGSNRSYKATTSGRGVCNHGRTSWASRNSFGLLESDPKNNNSSNRGSGSMLYG